MAFSFFFRFIGSPGNEGFNYRHHTSWGPCFIPRLGGFWFHRLVVGQCCWWWNADIAGSQAIASGATGEKSDDIHLESNKLAGIFSTFGIWICGTTSVGRSICTCHQICAIYELKCREKSVGKAAVEIVRVEHERNRWLEAHIRSHQYISSKTNLKKACFQVSQTRTVLHSWTGVMGLWRFNAKLVKDIPLQSSQTLCWAEANA